MPTTGNPDPQPQRENRFSRVHPQIFVTDIERALAFYRDQLGFELAYLWGEPPFYGLVVRDEVGLNLRHVDELPFDVATCAREELLAAAIVVDDVKALYLALRDAGVPMLRRLTEQPWGVRDFVVTDPDGNQLQLTSPAPAG